MDLVKLRLFVRVAELGSLTRAAVILDAVPSAISRQIAAFERECGGRLFNRTGRGLTLTELGERLLPRATAILAEADRLEEEIRNCAGVPRGEVRLGLVPSLSYPLVNRLFSAVQTQFPEIRLHLSEGSSGQLDEMLAAGTVDMAVLFRFDEALDADEQELMRADTYLVGPPGDAVTSRPTVEFSRLDRLPLALPDVPNGLRVVLDRIARKAGIQLSVVLEANSLLVQRSLAAEGRAYAILAGPAVEEEMRAGVLQGSRIVNPEIGRIITLSVTRRRPTTLAGREVCRLIRRIVQEAPQAVGSHARERSESC